MGDENDRQPTRAAQFVKDRENLRLHRHVQRGCRFISDDDVGIIGQGHRDPDPLTHPTRHLVRVVRDALLSIWDAHGFQKVNRLFAPCNLVDATVCPDRLDQLVTNPVERMQRGKRILKNIRDGPTTHVTQTAVRHADQVFTFEIGRAIGDHTGRRSDKPHDRQRRDRLTGPAFANDAKAFALFDM